jgi:4-amino-4-deoxy-L-arabinose transferase-like glycosyltransferase
MRLELIRRGARARWRPASFGRTLTEAWNRPGAGVGLLAITLFVLWGALSAAFNPAPPADSLEQVLLSQELRLEYGKHPPLPTWILHGVNRLFGPSIGVTFVLGALCSVLTLLLLYAWARPLVGAPRAALATALASTIEFLNAGTAYFNHNTVQLPLAMLAVLLFHRAVTRGRLADWALLGLGGALMMLAKFSALILFASFFFYLAWAGRLREVSVRRGLALAALVCGSVLAPQLVAVFGDAWAPNRYAMEALFPAQVDRLDRLKSVWSFASSQLAKVAPALLIFALLRWRATKAAPVPDDRVPLGPFLAIVGFGPFVLTIVVALVSGARLLVGWGTTFHLLLTLWLVTTRPFAIDATPRLLRRAVLACIATQVALWSVVIGFGGRLPNLNRKAPQELAALPPQLAGAIQREWAQHSAAPLRYVVADVRTGALLAVQFDGRPRVVDGTRPEVSKNFPPHLQSACGAVVVVSTRSPGSAARSAHRELLDAFLEATVSRTVIDFPMQDGSRRRYVIGVRTPLPGKLCA